MHSPLNNHYFLMRHGESTANIRGVILSDPEEGKKAEHTLTPHGEEQARHSAEDARERGILDADTVIYSSPFSRCRRTAEIAKKVFGVKEEIIVDDRLRERWFGEWEGTSNVNYQKVWEGDGVDPGHKNAGVESTAQVVARVSSLIHDLEARYADRNILLVSHGDTLQIVQTFFEGKPSSAHRSLWPLATAEIREVVVE